MTDTDLMTQLTAIADEHFDGHVTVMKFTTNWRVGFGTPMSRCDIDMMWESKTFSEAAERALSAFAAGTIPDDCATHRMLWRQGISGECPYCGDILPSANPQPDTATPR